MPADEHRILARNTPVRFAVLTISDTRDKETDKSGKIILEKLEALGHTCRAYEVVQDDALQIRAQLQAWAQTVEVILTNGGTGISKRDTTFEVVSDLLEKTLPGFGEIFRMLSYEEIGAAAMLSRAVCGVYQDTILFSMPGSSNAVILAMEKLIAPELQHLVWELIRQQAQ